MTHGREKSDPAIVAGKSTNKNTQLSAESMEPRAGAKGNAIERGMRRTQRRESMSHGLDRVRQAFRRQTPEVGARCGNSARRDLCGGHTVMRVSTAILQEFRSRQCEIQTGNSDRLRGIILRPLPPTIPRRHRLPGQLLA